VHWIKGAHTVPLDVGQLTTENQQQQFLNVASVGISGEITQRINNQKKRYPWTFTRPPSKGY